MARAKPPAKKPAGKAAPAKKAQQLGGTVLRQKAAALAAKKPADAAPARKPGGQSIFDMAIVEAICDRIAAGQVLEDILKDEGMPCRLTFWNWRQQRPEVMAAFLAAKEVQVERYVDETIAIADEQASFPADVARNKVRVTARQWYAEKLVPKAYGQKIGIGGAEGLPPVKHKLDVTLNPADEYKRLINGG